MTQFGHSHKANGFIFNFPSSESCESPSLMYETLVKSLTLKIPEISFEHNSCKIQRGYQNSEEWKLKIKPLALWECPNCVIKQYIDQVKCP